MEFMILLISIVKWWLVNYRAEIIFGKNKCPQKTQPNTASFPVGGKQIEHRNEVDKMIYRLSSIKCDMINYQITTISY